MALNCDILNNYISEKDCILIGVSGGADSMCLLDLVFKYSKKCNFSYYAVHINHNLRGEEALRDQNLVFKYCKERKIKVVGESIDTKGYADKNGKTIEQAGRELRYKVFGEVANKIKANKIFIAHHKDDQAETILMHILRGASLKGAGGISYQTNNIYRPLLDFTRKDIEKYNYENLVDYVIDSSNKDVKYVRNYMRNVVIPGLEKIYPNAVNAICNFGEKCKIDEEFIQKQLKTNYVSMEKNGVSIDIRGLEDDFSLSSRLIKHAIEKLNVFADIEEKHIVDIIKLKDKENGKSINLTNNLIAVKEYFKIVIKKNTKKVVIAKRRFSFGAFDFDNFGKVYIEQVYSKGENAFSKNSLYLDLDKIPENAVIRCREKGDQFRKFGSGNKSLSDYLTDKKVPKENRDGIPVLAINDKILCVFGMEISDDVKITPETKNIVKISKI